MKPFVHPGQRISQNSASDKEMLMRWFARLVVLLRLLTVVPAKVGRSANPERDEGHSQA